MKSYIELEELKKEVERLQEEVSIRDRYVEVLENEIDILDTKVIALEENNKVLSNSCLESHGKFSELEKGFITLERGYKMQLDEACQLRAQLAIFKLYDRSGIRVNVGDTVKSIYNKREYKLGFGRYIETNEDEENGHHGWYCINENEVIGVANSTGIWFNKVEDK